MSDHVSRWRDRGMNAAVLIATCVLVGAVAWLVVDLLRTAWPRLSWSFLVELPRRSGRSGGILSILVSTMLMLLVCWSVVLPLGLGAAVALSSSHVSQRWDGWKRFARTSLDVLSGIPSIVLGMFGLLIFGEVMGLGFSIASGGLTLACVILPLVIRVADAALRTVPKGLLANAAALGLSRTTTLLRLILPAAMPGLVAAGALGTARALAETGALVFTAGASDRMPGSLADPGRTLSVHIYELAMNVAGGDASAAASAIVLLLILIIIQAGVAALFGRLRGTSQ